MERSLTVPSQRVIQAVSDGSAIKSLTARPGLFRILCTAARNHGVLVVASLVRRRLGELVRVRRAESAELCAGLVRGKAGLEIGGPSGAFSRRGPLPIYRHADRMDNCNFAGETVWEGEIDEGAPYRPGRGLATGTQFIREATALKGIADEAYDFVCSSHTLEHVANPLAALEEWLRVLRPGGTLVLLLPHKDGTFDHRRPVTTLVHIMDDHAKGTGEDDLTHLDEILELHDLARDPLAGGFADFKARSRINSVNRCLHHHVFDTKLAVRLVDHAGLQIVAAERAGSIDIILICSKPEAGVRSDNRVFLADTAEFRGVCPSPSSRANSRSSG